MRRITKNGKVRKDLLKRKRKFTIMIRVCFLLMFVKKKVQDDVTHVSTSSPTGNSQSLTTNRLVLVGALVASLGLVAHGWPSGAPENACSSMVPQHVPNPTADQNVDYSLSSSQNGDGTYTGVLFRFVLCPFFEAGVFLCFTFWHITFAAFYQTFLFYSVDSKLVCLCWVHACLVCGGE